MTEDFRIESHLLAVKEFKPGKNVSAERASAVTRLWTWQVLDENGVEPGDVMGVVCDGGASDIYCAFNNVDGVMFEWCIAHQLNHAIIDGFGLSAAPWKSNNPEARAVIFNVKKDVECMKKSEPAKVRRGSIIPFPCFLGRCSPLTLVVLRCTSTPRGGSGFGLPVNSILFSQKKVPPVVQVTRVGLIAVVAGTILSKSFLATFQWKSMYS